MFKKTLIMAASAAALAAGPAMAGDIVAEIADVNPTIGLFPGVDINSFGTGCGGGVGLIADYTCGHTSLYTVDTTEGWIIGDPHDFAPIVIFAKERFVSQAHPLKAHFEVDVFDKEDIFQSESQANITVLGGAFKASAKGSPFSPNQIIRAGRDQNFSLSAFSSNQIQPGDTSADFLLQTDGSESAVGFILPLMVTTSDECDLSVQFSFSRQVAGSPFGQTTDPLQLTTCKHSLLNTVSVKDVHVDYRQSFKGFLVPYGLNREGKETFVQQLYADIGAISFDLHRNMVDPKQPIVDNENIKDRYFDASDISRWQVTVQFEDLLGLKSAELVSKSGGQSVSGTLDYDSDTVTFDISGSDLEILDYPANCEATVEELYNRGFGGGGGKDSCSVHLRVHAWGPGPIGSGALDYFPKGSVLPGKKDDDGKTVLLPDGKGANGEKLFRSLQVNGAIKHQQVFLVQNEFTLSPNETEDPHVLGEDDVKFDSPKNIAEGSLIGKLKVNGQVFGPFDWVADMTLPVRSAFRVTHLPSVDGHGNAIEIYEGIMTLKNSSSGSQYDRDYKFFIPADSVVNGERLLMPRAMEDIIEADGGPVPANWGRADVTWNFFLESTKVDVDRLLNTAGTFADFGDAGNDANSEHAISGDEGRFGPKKGGKIIVNHDGCEIDQDVCSTR